MSTETDIEIDFRPRFIAARELKRRGIASLDKDLVEGPVYVIKNDQVKYVVLTVAYYQDLLEDAQIAEVVRVKEAEADLAAGRVRVTSAEDLIKEFRLND